MSSNRASEFSATSGWLTGQILIAMPNMPDPRFARTVIYICSHGPTGAMGLVLNRLLGEASFHSLLAQLNIPVTDATPNLPIHHGGPVETTRGFVLHSTDYSREGMVAIDDSIGLSATIEILQAISEGHGPERFMMALGYTGWDSGQLDNEIKSNGWITAPADDALLFDSDLDTKWERALSKIGISPFLLSGDAGHA